MAADTDARVERALQQLDELRKARDDAIALRATVAPVTPAVFASLPPARQLEVYRRVYASMDGVERFLQNERELRASIARQMPIEAIVDYGERRLARDSGVPAVAAAAAEFVDPSLSNAPPPSDPLIWCPTTARDAAV